MSNFTMLIVALVVFCLLLTGLVLTMLEFSKMEDPSKMKVSVNPESKVKRFN